MPLDRKTEVIGKVIDKGLQDRAWAGSIAKALADASGRPWAEARRLLAVRLQSLLSGPEAALPAAVADLGAHPDARLLAGWVVERAEKARQPEVAGRYLPVILRGRAADAPLTPLLPAALAGGLEKTFLSMIWSEALAYNYLNDRTDPYYLSSVGNQVRDRLERDQARLADLAAAESLLGRLNLRGAWRRSGPGPWAGGSPMRTRSDWPGRSWTCSRRWSASGARPAPASGWTGTWASEGAAMSTNNVRTSMNRTVRRMLRAAPAGAAAGRLGRRGRRASPRRRCPAGAMVVAEAPDFKSLKAAWDGSAARPAWEASAALEMFKRSRLFLKLEDRRSLLSLAAGAELDEAFLDGLQAGRTIAAVYDPGRREALLMVELAHGGGGEALAALLKTLPEQRHLGLAYRGRYLEEENVYLGAFQAGNRLYLASSERLVKEVVRLSKEGGGYRLPEFPAGAASLRLDVDLDAIRKTSYFRRYWLPPDRSAWAPTPASGWR